MSITKWLITLLLFGWYSASSFAAPINIEDLQVNVTIHADGHLSIKEQGVIHVRPTKWLGRISRTLPINTFNRQPLGYQQLSYHSIGPQAAELGVLRKKGQNWEIWFNPSGQAIPQGRYPFTLSYELWGALRSNDETQSYSWNTRTWGPHSRAAKAHTTVHLPQPLHGHAQSPAHRPVFGMRGSKEPILKQLNPGQWQGVESDGRFAALHWPVGLLPEASGLKHLSQAMGDVLQRPAAIGETILSLIKAPSQHWLGLMLAYWLLMSGLLQLWRRRPMLKPLAELTPAQAATLWHGWVGRRSYIAYALHRYQAGQIRMPTATSIHPYGYSAQPQPLNQCRQTPDWFALENEPAMKRWLAQHRQPGFWLWLPMLPLYALGYINIYDMKDGVDIAASLFLLFIALFFMQLGFTFWSELYPSRKGRAASESAGRIDWTIAALISCIPIGLGLACLVSPLLIDPDPAPDSTPTGAALIAGIFLLGCGRFTFVRYSPQAHRWLQALKQQRAALINGQWQTDRPAGQRFCTGLAWAVALGAEQQWLAQNEQQIRPHDRDHCLRADTTERMLHAIPITFSERLNLEHYSFKSDRIYLLRFWRGCVYFAYRV